MRTIRRPTSVIVIVILCVATIVMALGVWRLNYLRFNATTRAEWIKQAVQHLRNFNPNPSTPQVQVLTMGTGFCYYVEGSGILRFSSNEWIYIVTHSFHQDTKFTIGDVILAVDNHGKLYECDAHPCNGAQIVVGSGKPFQDTEAFLAHTVELGGKNWKEMQFPGMPEDTARKLADPQH